jgi:hypothetical protein
MLIFEIFRSLISEELYKKINDFIYDERERRRTLLDPTRKILSKRRETVYLDKPYSRGTRYGMKISTITIAKSVMPNSIAAQNMLKDGDIVTEINDRSTVNLSIDGINKIVSSAKVLNLTIDRQNSLGAWKVGLHRYDNQRFGISFGTKAFIDDVEVIINFTRSENNLLPLNVKRSVPTFFHPTRFWRSTNY